jgi:hypothetical protein
MMVDGAWGDRPRSGCIHGIPPKVLEHLKVSSSPKGRGLYERFALSPKEDFIQVPEVPSVCYDAVLAGVDPR